MSFSVAEQITRMLDRVPSVKVELDRVLANQAEVFLHMMGELDECATGPPFTFSVKDAAAPVASSAFDRVMDEPNRRILIIMDAGVAFGSTPQLTIKGVVKGGERTEVVDIPANGEYLTDLAFDQVTTAAAKILANADLVAAGGTIQLLRNYGEVSDIEARWAAGLYLLEKQKKLRNDSQDPSGKIWAKKAEARFMRFLERHCTGPKPGQFRGGFPSRGPPLEEEVESAIVP